MESSSHDPPANNEDDGARDAVLPRPVARRSSSINAHSALFKRNKQNDKYLFEIMLLVDDDDKRDASSYRRVVGVNNELHETLNAHKNDIHLHNRKWDRFKKATNDYELISSNTPEYPEISAYRPISRSFYKLWEILFDFDRSIIRSPHRPMRAMFLAEGPGGFVEAFSVYRRRFYDNVHHRDSLHGMTLQSPDRQVPYWNQNECKRYRMRVHRGQDGTGDLYNLTNVAHTVSVVGRASCDLVTADGGFDFSGNFNTQEECSSELIACQTFAALHLLCEGGVYVLKLYDIRIPATFRLIHLLRLLFESAHFVKPLTSRPANSEKYLVCTGFLASRADAVAPRLFESFREDIASKRIDYAWVPGVFSMLPETSRYAVMSQAFLCHIVFFNAHYVRRQTAFIRKTLALLVSSTCAAATVAAQVGVGADSDRNHQDDDVGEHMPPSQPPTLMTSLLTMPIRRQVTKCVNWCSKYKIPVSREAMVTYGCLFDKIDVLKAQTDE